MIEKLKNLPFISVKESDKDRNDLLFISKNLNENGEIDINMFCKSFTNGSISIKDNDDIIDSIEKIFIDRIKIIETTHIINMSKAQIEDFASQQEGYLEVYPESNKNLLCMVIDMYLDNNLDNFIMIPIDFEYAEILNENYNVYKTSNLKDEIIFGRKTKPNEPGMILVTNEERLSNKNDIKFAIVDVGFFPYDVYYKIKLSSYSF